MLYDADKDQYHVTHDLQLGERFLQAMGYQGYRRQGLLATFSALQMSEGPKDSPFRSAAFLGANGTVYETGPFHDPEALPKGTEVSAEGFVDKDGRFFSRDQATELLHSDHQLQSEELDLNKSQGQDNSKKMPNNSQRGFLTELFTDQARKYLGKYNNPVGKLDRENILRRLKDAQETIEAIVSKKGQHPAFQVAAKMAGHPADATLRQDAEKTFGDDVIAVALAAHGLDPHDEGLRMQIEAALQSMRLEKTELNVAVLPRVVEEGQDGAEHMAMVIRQAFAHNLVYEVRLGGKHSAGAAVAYDAEDDRFWLLKPGSARVSPAKGVSDTNYTQSRREAVFAQAARAYDSMRQFYPECWLLLLDGIEVACQEVMGPGYRPAQKYGDAEQLLKPYQDSLDVYRWAFWDWVLGNPDSHGGNLLITEDGRVALIDHGSALAGANFNPPADPKASFIPYYLRVFRNMDFEKMTPEQRYNAFPHPTPDERQVFAAWVQGLGDGWVQVVEHLAPDVLPAAMARCKALVTTTDPTDALMRSWAGMDATDLHKAESVYDKPTMVGEKEPKEPWKIIDRPVTVDDAEKYLAYAKKTKAGWGTPDPMKLLMEWAAYKPNQAIMNEVFKRAPAKALFTAKDGAFATPYGSYMVALDKELNNLEFTERKKAKQAIHQIATDKFIQGLPSFDKDNIVQAAREFSADTLNEAPESEVLRVMRHLDAMPMKEADQLAWAFQEAYAPDGGVNGNKDLGKAFADWAINSPHGDRYLSQHNPALQHVPAEHVVNLLKEGIKAHGNLNRDLLHAPQLSVDQIHDVLKDPTIKDRALDDIVKPYNLPADKDKAAAIVHGVLENPTTEPDTRWQAASAQHAKLTPAQMSNAIAEHEANGGDSQEIGSMIMHQWFNNPNQPHVLHWANKYPLETADAINENGYKPGQKNLLSPNDPNWFEHDQKLSKAKHLHQLMQQNPDVLVKQQHRDVMQFWHDYEKDVEPHHFAVVHKHLTNSPTDVTIDFHRHGSKGYSKNYPGVAEGLGKHAQLVQKAVLEDENAPIKDIEGKPHVLVYRGVAGNYAKEAIGAIEGGASDLNIPNAQLSSWSADPAQAKNFASRRISGMPKAGIIIRKWLPVEDILHSGCHRVDPWQKHAHTQERELIFKHTQPTMNVKKEDIYVHSGWTPPKDGVLSSISVKTPQEQHGTAESHLRTHVEHVRQHVPNMHDHEMAGHIGHGGHDDNDDEF